VLGTARGGKEVTLMHAEVFQIAAVAVVVVAWYAADSYSRRMRRAAKRSRAARVMQDDERAELIDADALSASDD
jgi:predicted Co/Zn/Cd cation transporter (cation efflux family)